MLGVEESNARLLERVTQQEEGLSILKSAHLGTYLFCPWLMPLNFSFPCSRICRPFPELGGKIGSLEQELEMVKAAVGRSMEALAQSLEE